MKTNSWTTAGQAKDKLSSPNPLVKVLEEAVIESEAQTAVVQLKSEVKEVVQVILIKESR